MITEEQISKNRELGHKAGFDSFMRSGSIRLLTSMIPAGDKAEILETLLREAFKAGCQCGEGVAMIEFLREMVSKAEGRR